MSNCIHCRVSGVVQGVFFRASAREQARSLGLVGWVRNLPDGRVEVLACGEESRLEAMLDWLREGPPHANVSGVDFEWQEPDSDYVDFEVY